MSDTQKSVRVIVNGAAGGGRCRRASEPLIERLRGRFPLDVRFTTGPGHATRLARQAADEEVETVLAVGGDGTVFEVLNGLFPRHSPHGPALGVIPLGTGNSFVRDFELHQVDRAVDAVIEGKRRSCDVVRVRHTEGEFFFLNLLSLGFSARAGALTNRRFKHLGRAGYVLAVVASVARLKHPCFPIRVDQHPTDPRPCTLLSFSNSRYTGGDMMMAPCADPTDGRLDVIRVGTMGRRRLLSMFPKIFSGTHTALAEVEVATATKVTLDLDGPVEVMVDGEVMVLQLTDLQILPSALEFVA